MRREIFSCRKNTFEPPNVEPLYSEAIQRRPGVFTQYELPNNEAEDLSDTGYTTFEDHQDGGLVPEGLNRNEGRQGV